MAKKGIQKVARDILDGFLEEQGYELYHLEFVKEGRDRFLRVYIDLADPKDEERISTADCERVSKYLSERLDQVDPTDENYYLEVSSPGLDRPLVTPEHYRRAIGQQVDVRLYRAVDGAKEWSGILQEYDEEGITICDADEESHLLRHGEISGTRLAVII